MLALTLQIYNVGNWQDAMTVTFDEPERGFDSRCSFGYETSYLVEHIESIPSSFAGAVSATAPIAWEGQRTTAAPAFLHDIAPAGAAKRFLMSRLGGEKPEGISA